MIDNYNIVVAGAGFSGGIVATQLKKHTKSDVIILDKCTDIGSSESGTALNINPNWIRSLQSLDPELNLQIISAGLPRNSIRAEKISWKLLYDLPMCIPGWENMALNPGLRIWWKDAYTVIRKDLEVEYNQEVIDYEIDKTKNKGTISISVLDRVNKRVRQISGIDFLISTDGRYSKIRESISPFVPNFIGVSNFRLLIPDTSGGLFDDFELFYTENPIGRELVTDNQNPDFIFSLESLPRLWVMKVPKSDSWGGDMLWIFGNFWIMDEIPDFAKTSQGLIQLYAPRDGVTSDKWEYLLKVISENSSSMHWSRMQSWPICFGDPEKKILLLGDSAHCISPAMGQWATLAIEDACVGAKVIIEDINKGHLDGNTIRKIAEMRSRRREFVAKVSSVDSKHLIHRNSSSIDTLLRQTQIMSDKASFFRQLMEKVWRNWPTLSFNK